MSANHLTDKQWLDEMTIELRLRNVRGDAIGDALAAVETHCAESGERPVDAFGDPHEYARALDFRPPQFSDNRPSGWAKVLGPIAAGLVAANLVPGVVRALFDGSAVAISWSDLVSVALLALVVVVFIKFRQPLLHHKLLGIPYLGVAVAMLAMLPTLLPAVAFTLPTGVAIALVVVFLSASVLGMWWQRYALDDPIIDPRTRERTSPLLTVLTIWLFPIVALGTGLLTAVPLWFAR